MNPQLTVMTQIRGGVFTRADARACGYPDPDIDSLLDSGGWRRIRRNTYAPDRLLLPVTEEMLHLRRLHHLLRYGGRRLIASHQSAIALHALPTWGLDLSTLHVTATDGRPGRHAGGVHRHVRDLSGVISDVQTWNGLSLVSPARAVAEVAATAPLAPALVVAEAALYAGLVTPASLRRAAGRLTAQEARKSRAVLARLSPLSASVAETRLRSILAEAELPAPSAEEPPPIDGIMPGSEPETAALWFPEQRTVVEFEAWRHYWRPEEDWEEVEQAYDPPPRGFAADPPPLEYCWIDWQELDEPGRVVERLSAAFARAAARSGVRLFDPDRPRTRRRRTHLPARAADDSDLPC